MTHQANTVSTMVLMPVFNDWESAFEVVARLHNILATENYQASFLLVDDGSSDSPAIPAGIDDTNVTILRLRRNLGHQRAICIGISWLTENLTDDSPVVLMDSDGEDRPEDVPRLLKRYVAEQAAKIVFAERTKRSEGILFAVFYNLYCLMHLFLVGQRVRFGNFSVIPATRLKSLSIVPELWNHYAAAVLASKQPYVSVSTSRGERYFGKSKMNFVGLVIHGLSALSVFSDRLGVRVSLFVTGLLLVVASALSVVVGIRLFTELAIPGWATFSGGLLILSAIQLITVLFVFCFMILANRTGNTFLPIRDYRYFIDHVERLSD